MKCGMKLVHHSSAYLIRVNESNKYFFFYRHKKVLVKRLIKDTFTSDKNKPKTCLLNQ